MRFYTHRHEYYCGIDLHTSVMYVCITDAAGTVLVHKNLRTKPESFARLIEPYREDLAVAVECVFVRYWIADLCARLGVTFVLGHALYMRSLQFASANCRRSPPGFCNPWWQGEERPDRQREDRPASAQWHAS